MECNAVKRSSHFCERVVLVLKLQIAISEGIDKCGCGAERNGTECMNEMNEPAFTTWPEARLF